MLFHLNHNLATIPAKRKRNWATLKGIILPADAWENQDIKESYLSVVLWHHLTPSWTRNHQHRSLVSCCVSFPSRFPLLSAPFRRSPRVLQIQARHRLKQLPISHTVSTVMPYPLCLSQAHTKVHQTHFAPFKMSQRLRETDANAKKERKSDVFRLLFQRDDPWRLSHPERRYKCRLRP